MYTTYRIIFLERGEVIESTIHVNHYKKDMQASKFILSTMIENHRSKKNIVCLTSHNDILIDSKDMNFIERPFDIIILELSDVLIDYLIDLDELEEREERGKINRKKHADIICKKQLN